MMLSKEVYKNFLKTVVKTGVFSQDELARDTVPLSDEIIKQIETGKRFDHRLPWMARISGKGGIDSRGIRHETVRNVSLLEHVTSVARGAMVFAEQDLRAAGDGADEAALGVRLARVASVGFLHDADKMVSRGRELLNAETIGQLIHRYSVDTFLAGWDASASPEWMLAMIDQAEVSRAGRLVPGGVMLSLSDRTDAGYVRCADRVEGKFLVAGPRAALDELNAFEGFRTPLSLRNRWRTVDIYQPHIPFVLDALHIGFANGCDELAGVAPLIESCQDGRLIAVVPKERFEEICEHALGELARRFRTVPRVSVNSRWAIDVHDARPTVEGLHDAVSEENVKKKLLAVASEFAAEDAELRVVIDETVGDLGVAIKWPPAEKLTGAKTELLPSQAGSRNEAVFRKARMLAFGLGCKKPKDTALAKATPDPGKREAALLDLLKAHEVNVPEVFRYLDDAVTRRSLLALVAGGACECEPELGESIFGNAGLLMRWLDGADGYAGINERLPEDVSARFVKPVRDMLTQAIDGHFVAEAENAPRRCHFTNAPVEEGARYSSKTEGIYALKVSAFSGREGRPESHRSPRSGTYLSPLARTEHALRFRDNRQRDGKHVSFLLSSPSVSGLFASLTLGQDTDITEVSTYDLRTRDIKKARVRFHAFDSFERRILIGRYEAYETGLAEALGMVLRIVEASLRTGRPIHVFQGAPHEVRDRVYFDSLPHEIERGLGSRGFRIEDLEKVRNQLRTWSDVCGVNGLGVSAATAMMDPDTRLAALCAAVDQIDRRGDNGTRSALRLNLLHQAQGVIMTDTKASPIVRFARAMTGFQSAPHRESSQADRTRGMRLALEALDSVSVAGTTDRETVICAVVAEIENAAERETDKQFTKLRKGEPTHKEALTRAAEIFADEVWPEVFKRRPPDSKSRRSAVSIYRVAFERAHQLRKSGEAVFPASSFHTKEYGP